MYEELASKTLDGLPIVLSGPEVVGAGWELPKPILGQWLCEGNQVMIFGKTGIGKSWFTYAAALHIASGIPMLQWEVPEPRRVLYFDAEIDPAEIADRVRRLSPGSVPDKFTLCSGLRLPEGLPPIDDPDGRRWYLEQIEEAGAEVVVLDNLCSVLLDRSISDDDAWLPVQPFLNQLRSKKISFVIVHHAGKKGEFLGTSRMTQNLNTVVRLERPQNYDARQGAVLELSFDKGRAFYGDDAGGYKLALIEEDGRLGWSGSRSEDGQEQVLERVAEMVRSREFGSQEELGDALGKGQATVSGLLSKAEKAGHLDRGEAKQVFAEVRRCRKSAEIDDEEV